MLAGVHRGNPFAYHYEMFNSADSLERIVKQVASSEDLFNIYIGAHGDETRIDVPGKETITRSRLRNLLAKIQGVKLHGLFLGCCGFGKQVEYIASETSLTWIAGYTKSIDWIHSSAMDLYFWNAYYLSTVSDYVGSKKELAGNMEVFLSALYSRVPYLFSELGFRVAVSRKKGQFKVFPTGWDETELLHWKIEMDKLVNERPGQWP